MECKYCNTIFEDQQNFCTNCGKQLSGRVLEKNSERQTLNLIIAFYAVTILLLGVNLGFKLYHDTGLFFEAAIHIIDIAILMAFVFLDLKPLISLYNIPKFHWNILIFSLVFPIISSLAVHFSMSLLSELLNVLDYNYFFEYHQYNQPVFYAVLFVAILPPVFEELAFRGFLHNQLLKISTPQIAIIGSAFLFALVHFSILSIVWIFPFGLILGYIRHKYNTLWYGMLIHFIHNLIVLFIDYQNFYTINL